MPSYGEGFIHLLYAIILRQFVVIAVFLGGFSDQYAADDYFRAWVNNNYPWMGLMLQGQADALLVGMALATTVLMIQRMRRKEESRSVITQLLSQEKLSSRGSDRSDRLAPPGNESPSVGSHVEAPSDILAELEKSD